MAVVFLETGQSPIPIQMASSKLHRGPHRRGMSIRAVQRKDTQINQTQFVAESRIFSIALLGAIEISLENNDQKLTMTTVKTNKPRSL